MWLSCIPNLFSLFVEIRVVGFLCEEDTTYCQKFTIYESTTLYE